MSDAIDTLAELDVVALTRPLSTQGLPAGQTGTVMFVHNHDKAYEVEFVIRPMRSIVATVGRDHLLKLHGLPAAVAG